MHNRLLHLIVKNSKLLESYGTFFCVTNICQLDVVTLCPQGDCLFLEWATFQPKHYVAAIPLLESSWISLVRLWTSVESRYEVITVSIFFSQKTEIALNLQFENL